MERKIRSVIFALSCTLSMTSINGQRPTADSQRPLVTIACLSDIHSMNEMLTPSSGKTSDIKARASFANAVNKIRKEEDIDILILGGDYQSDKTIDKANFMREREVLAEVSHKAFREGKTPYVIWLTGNHDFEVANCDKLPKPYNAGDYYTFPMKDDVGELSKDDSFYEEADNGDSGKMELLAAYHYHLAGCHFVVLNTAKYFFANAWNYSYSEESVKWVADKLNSIYDEDPKARVFFLVHVPFSESNSLDQGKGMVDNNAAKSLKKALSSHSGLIMVYGHDHAKETGYTHFLTSQRATVYSTSGSLMPTYDATHVKGETTEEERLIRPDSEGLVHAGEFSLYNPFSGMYLTAGSKDFTLDSTATNIRVTQASEGLFNITHHVLYRTSTLHHSSKDLFCRGTASQFMLYKVEDPASPLPHAIRAYGIVPGASYIVVAKEADACYAMTGSLYKAGTDDECVSHVKVELSGDSIHFLYPVSANRTVWTFHQTSASYCDSAPDQEGRVGLGQFVIWNTYAQKYLSIDSNNLTLSDDSHNFTLDNKNGTCRLISTYDFTKYSLHIGKGGLFSRGDASEIMLFRVEDPTAALPHATRAYRVKSDETYILVCRDDSVYYAMTGSVYKQGTSAQRMNHVQVEVKADTVHFLYPKSADRTLWTLRDVEKENTSFTSIFMGSMRYYYNAIDVMDPSDSPTIVQGLMIYVYDNRAVFQVRNYNKTGIISGSIVASVPSSYTVYYPEQTDIQDIREKSDIGPATNTQKQKFNLAGQVVNDSYKGIVIINGKKYINNQ